MNVMLLPLLPSLLLPPPVLPPPAALVPVAPLANLGVDGSFAGVPIIPEAESVALLVVGLIALGGLAVWRRRR